MTIKEEKIQTGDIIEFTNTSTLEKMSCRVYDTLIEEAYVKAR